MISFISLFEAFTAVRVLEIRIAIKRHEIEKIIKITSDAAIYNRKTNDMLFKYNVRMTESENELLAEFLEMDTSDNFITAYNDIKYTGLDGLVLADKVEIDLTKKTSKISMYTDERIKMIFTN